MQQRVSDQQVGQGTADCSHRTRSSLTTLPTKQTKKTSILQISEMHILLYRAQSIRDFKSHLHFV